MTLDLNTLQPGDIVYTIGSDNIDADRLVWGPVIKENRVMSRTRKVRQTQAIDGSVTIKEEFWLNMEDGPALSADGWYQHNKEAWTTREEAVEALIRALQSELDQRYARLEETQRDIEAFEAQLSWVRPSGAAPKNKVGEDQGSEGKDELNTDSGSDLEV